MKNEPSQQAHLISMSRPTRDVAPPSKRVLLAVLIALRPPLTTEIAAELNELATRLPELLDVAESGDESDGGSYAPSYRGSSNSSRSSSRQ